MNPNQIEEEVNHWISEVGIEEYADRKCATYSGGNKRKLNVAQALVADPPIVFLDEPSSGVDPASRRKLWKIIRSVQVRYLFQQISKILEYSVDVFYGTRTLKSIVFTIIN